MASHTTIRFTIDACWTRRLHSFAISFARTMSFNSSRSSRVGPSNRKVPWPMPSGHVGMVHESLAQKPSSGLASVEHSSGVDLKSSGCTGFALPSCRVILQGRFHVGVLQMQVDARRANIRVTQPLGDVRQVPFSGPDQVGGVSVAEHVWPRVDAGPPL